MNCQEFAAQLNDPRSAHESSAGWEEHRRCCAECRQMFEIISQLQLEATAVEPQKLADTFAIVHAIQRRAARAYQRRQQCTALAAAACVVLVALWIGRFGGVQEEKLLPRPKHKTVASTQPPASAVTGQRLATDAQQHSAPVATTIPQEQVRQAVMHVVDQTGNVREVNVMVLNAAPRPLTFDELSPIEREMIREYLRSQGQAIELTSF